MSDCKAHLNQFGYFRIRLGDGSRKLVHRLVMEAELGRPLGRDELVHHIDSDRVNNDPANLQLMSKQTHKALHWGSKLDAHTIQAIREGRGIVSQRKLARRYGVGQTTIRDIQLGKTWKGVGLHV